VGKATEPPKWIKPQLTRVVDQAPAGDEWLHEIKYDGYRMHARLDRGKIQLLTRTGLDWTGKYRFTSEALHALPVKTAYLDGELYALRPDGVPAFSRLQAVITPHFQQFKLALQMWNKSSHGNIWQFGTTSTSCCPRHS
jgi:bifunctional non-homologous end joining protein LigD